MDGKAYRPIDCGFHDELLARASLKGPVEIVYIDANGDESRRFETIDDVYTKDSAEYMRLESGTEIRLDQLVRVDGVDAPESPR